MARDKNPARDIYLGIFLLLVAAGVQASELVSPKHAPLIWGVAFILGVLLSRPYLDQVKARMDPVIAHIVFIGGFALLGGLFGWWVLASKSAPEFVLFSNPGNTMYLMVASENPRANERFALILFGHTVTNVGDRAATFKELNLVYDTKERRYETQATNWKTGTLVRSGKKAIVAVAPGKALIFMDWPTDIREKLAQRELVPANGAIAVYGVFLLEAGIWPGAIINTQIKVSDYSGREYFSDIEPLEDWREMFEFGQRLADRAFRMVEPDGTLEWL